MKGKLITRNTDYAVRALCFMAINGKEIISVDKLVKELKIPRPFLRKIMQALNKKGILQSYKGQGGGFTLSVPAEKIFLTDLITTFQGPLKLNECIFKKNICHNVNNCSLKNKIDTLEKYIISQLKSISVASLSEENNKILKKEGIPL
ncbi:MAG: Rrf2 family transcriptional regulator [Candidatus Omnitrophica bacterium]|nr:Rrf2 family transcriptional regulator [Candidatus Omnitrophota bacterium]